MKKFDEFINEDLAAAERRLDEAQKMHHALIVYIAKRLNDETKDILEEPIDLERDVETSKDSDSGGDVWFMSRITSKRLDATPDNETVEDYVYALQSAADAFRKLDVIYAEIYDNLGIMLHQMVSPGGMVNRIAIRTQVQAVKFIDNEKLRNFLSSQKGIDKYQL